MRRVLRLVCALGVLIALGGADARAATPGAVFALQPVGASLHAGYFVLDARPGMTLTRAVRVANTGTRAGTVLLYAVDATTGQTTGAVYGGRRDPRRDVGAWTYLHTGELRLSPNESRTVSFTIRVPRGVTDGQHLGGIVAENAVVARGRTRSGSRSSFRIDVRSLTIVAVQLDLPGARRELMTVTGVRPGGVGGRQSLLVGLRNDGNQLTRGEGQLTISDQQGTVIRQARFPLDTFVPHTEIADPVPIPSSALAPGSYQAIVTLRYGHGRTARLTAPFSISQKQVEQVFGSSPQQAPHSWKSASATPLLALVIAAIALVALGFLAALMLLRRRDSSPGDPEHARES